MRRGRPFSLTSVFASHPQNPGVTPFLATHPKTHVLKVLCLPHIQKMAGAGVVLLTRNPGKDFYPEGASRLKDLSSSPMRRVFFVPVISQRPKFDPARDCSSSTDHGSRCTPCFFLTSRFTPTQECGTLCGANSCAKPRPA